MYRLACLVFAAAVTLSAGDVNDELLTAARKGDLETVKALVEKGAPVEATTAYGQTPLYLAAMSGQIARRSNAGLSGHRRVLRTVKSASAVLAYVRILESQAVEPAVGSSAPSRTQPRRAMLESISTIPLRSADGILRVAICWARQ